MAPNSGERGQKRLGGSISRHIHIRGIVQGVGFRPKVFHLAQKHALSGWVINDASGVQIRITGEPVAMDQFLDDLLQDPPPQAVIDEVLVEEVAEEAFQGFQIRESANASSDFLPVSADLAICEDCKRELFDPSDRRYRYPFINCTNCGPRFSIVRGIPYDRPNTSMAGFPLCPDCEQEYHDPSDRRFHAQPVACAVCGPQIWYEADGVELSRGESALVQAKELLTQGGILAIKGLGGFHLACDAQNPQSLDTLRSRKHRTGKPFACMAFDLATVEKYLQLDDEACRLLTSSAAPVVLAEMTEAGKQLGSLVAPDQNRLGFMLAYTPLHLLLLEPQPGFPEVLVMTSGNLSEEPIAYRVEEARERLKGLADGFLMHDRPIETRIDDSVLTQLRGKPYFIRRARGFAPAPLSLPFRSEPLLAAGPELKNTFCLTRGEYAFQSHFIGDLENQETLEAYEAAINHYERIFRVKPAALACDRHPDYLATRYAQKRAAAENLPLFTVQHHRAHIAAVMAENQVKPEEKVIGLAYDGTGYGDDGTNWGGEVLLADYANFERRYHLAPVPLPGGDLAAREPARMAVSYLHAAGVGEAIPATAPGRYLGEETLGVILAQITKQVNAPLTSSMGRLFDAAAALLGLEQKITFEGQAAMHLESIAAKEETGFYPVPISGALLDGVALMRQLHQDLLAGTDRAILAARFHNSLAQLSLQVCLALRLESGINTVALSGGVWQNLYLADHTIALLEEAGFKVLVHHRLPPNDGCVAYGQAVVALANMLGFGG